jgi:hypothetical protein
VASRARSGGENYFTTNHLDGSPSLPNPDSRQGGLKLVAISLASWSPVALGNRGGADEARGGEVVGGGDAMATGEASGNGQHRRRACGGRCRRKRGRGGGDGKEERVVEVVVGCCGRGEAGEAVGVDGTSSGATAATAHVEAVGFPQMVRFLSRGFSLVGEMGWIGLYCRTESLRGFLRYEVEWRVLFAKM